MRALVGSGGETTGLGLENEARWRLVETAWEIGLSRSLIEFDAANQSFDVRRLGARVVLTSARPALNGYQKGHCFYCYTDIDLLDAAEAVDVDHFLPWTLRRHLPYNLDGVWNLVLACVECNRGPKGKFDLIPERHLLERLHLRNEFLISSHHPLRETLMAQAGQTEDARKTFLQARWSEAIQLRIGRWVPPASRCGQAVF